MQTHDVVVDSQARARRGVTLLEVIVSMGVLVVGLMGMAALIPLGRLELAEGDKMDNASTLGRSAFRELSVRGYLNPQMWVNPLTGASIAGPQGYLVEYPEYGPPFGPIIIDPLMIAPKFFGEDINASSLTSREQTHRSICRFFPYSLGLTGSGTDWPEKTAPKFARVTLRSYPANASAGGSLAPTMRFDVASRYFRSSDDLVVDLPADRARRPVQVFFQSEMTNLTITPYDGVTVELPQQQAAYRKFRGDYSWFFIVEPNPAERNSNEAGMPIAAGPRGSPYATHHYRVWVIVCNKRDLRETSNMALDKDRAVGERCVWIDFLDRYTARLRAHDITDEGTAAKVLDVKSNQWIAASVAYENPLLGGPPQYILEWFRIVNAAAEPQNIPGTNTWYREVAFTGRDLSTEGLLGPERFEGYKSDTDEDKDKKLEVLPLTAWGTIVIGVRGVYEKTIYLDRPSLWAPQ